MRLTVLGLGLCMFGSSALAVAGEQPFRDFANLSGQWTCHGVFPASGKTIDSVIRFESDLSGQAMVKHHDDTSPSSNYHALEAWGYDAKAARYNAVIMDNFGGARIFGSEGWRDGRLVWTSAPEVKPAQRFVYVRMPENRLRVDWEIERGGKMVIGDTLGCVQKSPG
ncbi:MULTISPECIES: hypothetical protein [Dyella]|uniref:DUF1579 domain-containing protein n=2 Tax=Dyella TaxID=231454 RepID=A0A4R0YRP8_9GAMM|nr:MULTISPECIES: hypothetical protein [Dyella]TBR40433.1 hypothetical protein EYV96_09835 [Dyella terrae]TCI11985.1 hypothetical protein EZM97_01035 [Dyella soli]